MEKKSQIQMGESIAVIVIIIVLLMVGIVFWSNIKKSDVTEIGRQSQELAVVELAKIVSELPELRCYNTNIVTKINCFDYYKLLAFNATVNNLTSTDILKYKRLYGDYFKNSRITFSIVYPEKMNIIIYDENITNTTSLQIMIPVIVERRLDRTGINYLGMIVVDGYYR